MEDGVPINGFDIDIVRRTGCSERIGYSIVLTIRMAGSETLMQGPWESKEEALKRADTIRDDLHAQMMEQKVDSKIVTHHDIDNPDKWVKLEGADNGRGSADEGPEVPRLWAYQRQH